MVVRQNWRRCREVEAAVAYVPKIPARICSCSKMQRSAKPLKRNSSWSPTQSSASLAIFVNSKIKVLASGLG